MTDIGFALQLFKYSWILILVVFPGFLDMIDITSYQSTSDTKVRQFWSLHKSVIALFCRYSKYCCVGNNSVNVAGMLRVECRIITDIIIVNVEYLRRQGIHCSSARYKCPIENIKLKLTTKSQIYKCPPEPLLMLANSPCYIVQPCFCK